MTKILGVSGKKGAGKNTVANILHGIVLKEKGMVKDFNIDQNGKLFVLTTNSDGEEGWGEFDISRKDEQFIQFAEYNMWPEVKLYSFADSLKWMCTDLFNIPYECVYGTNEQKNQIQEHLLWENMPGVITPENAWKIFYTFNSWNYHNLTQEEIKILDEKIKIQFSPQDFNPHNPTWCVFPDKGIFVHNSGPMTAREFMQFLATEVMRKIYSDIWVNHTAKKILREGSELAIIADVRFPNEVEKILSLNGKVVKLKRQISEDKHESEIALDNFDETRFFRTIDNSNGSLEDLIVDSKKLYKDL
jgi:hypothetical protein